MKKPSDLCLLMDTGNILKFDVVDWTATKKAGKIDTLDYTQPPNCKNRIVYVSVDRVIAVWEER